jgi:hypothetical protein
LSVVVAVAAGMSTLVPVAVEEVLVVISLEQ